MHDSFKDTDDRDDTNDSSIGTPGDLTDGRATMVPAPGFSTLQVSIARVAVERGQSVTRQNRYLYRC